METSLLFYFSRFLGVICLTFSHHIVCSIDFLLFKCFYRLIQIEFFLFMTAIV